MPSGESTNPYVGPVPFSQEKRDYFFGREKETKKLLSLAISERVVLFYAQSGAGKSSLINAGLAPGLKEYDYWMLPPARVGGALPTDLSAGQIDNVYTFNALNSLSGTRGRYRELLGMSLAGFLKERLPGPKEQPHWLVLDQFEEILTTYPEQYRQREEFFRQLREALDADKLLSVLLTMREDYIAGLDNYAALLPGRLEVRYRMEPLRRDAAELAVKRPAEKAGREYAPGVAESLVSELSLIRVGDSEEPGATGGDGEPAKGRFVPGEYVDPVQLQIVCFDLWKSLEKESAGRVITEYGDIDTALESYYEGAVEETARRAKVTANSVRRWFEEKLITPTGIRSQVNRSFRKTGGLPNAAVDILDNEYHLVRYVEVRGGKWYELAHDRYVVPILETNKKWLSQGNSPFYDDAKKWHAHGEDASFLYRGRRLREARRWVAQNDAVPSDIETEFLNASNLAEAKFSTVRNWAFGLLLTFLVLALGGMAFAWKQTLIAKDVQFRGAEQNRIILEERTKVTEFLRDKAEKEAEIALEHGRELGAKNEELREKEEELNDALRDVESAHLAALAAQKLAEKRGRDFEEANLKLRQALQDVESQRQEALAAKNAALEAEAKERAEREKAVASQFIAEERLKDLLEAQRKEQQAQREKEKAVEEAAQANAQVEEVKGLLTFVQHMRDYASRLALSGPEPNVFFQANKVRNITAYWNAEKRQYEVNPDFHKMRGLAEYVAIEGRFMAKHYTRCEVALRGTKEINFWQDFRYSATEYVLKTEQNLSGEGSYTGLPVENNKIYKLLKQIETKSGGGTQGVRKLSLALLDQYDCNWSFTNVAQKVREVNRKAGAVPDAAVVSAAKAAGL